MNRGVTFSLSGDMNEGAVGSEPPQNAKNRLKIGREQISLDSAQVAASDRGGPCQLDLGPALSETH